MVYILVYASLYASRVCTMVGIPSLYASRVYYGGYPLPVCLSGVYYGGYPPCYASQVCTMVGIPPWYAPPLPPVSLLVGNSCLSNTRFTVGR